MTDLSSKQCKPCRGGVPALQRAEADDLLGQIDGWRDQELHHIVKEFRFKNFAVAKEFVDRVSEVAEQQNHHPDIWFTWGKARIEIYTHSIDGLTESDFILAARIDQLTGAE